jgi:glycine/D-amino acid oxidase-like deaminating enzyme
MSAKPKHAATEPTYDAVIVGGGIVGTACALALAREGLRTALVEQNTIGGGATASGMGHIVVLDGSEAQFALSRHSQKLWQELAPKLPASAGFSQTGTLWVAADDDEISEAKRKQDYLAARGVPCRLLSASELAAQEPHLRSGLSGGLMVEQDAVVFSPVVADYLLREALALGATLYSGVTVTKLGHGEARLEDGRVLRAVRLVNAAGAGAPFCTPGLPIQKRKGHLAITDRYPGFVRSQLVELGYMKSAHAVSADSVAFNVQPRPTGQLLIGSSRQYGREDGAVEQAMLGSMLRRALEYLPALAGCNIVRTWTGFRAATPDKLPLIGPMPDDASLWLATGHEGLGITTALATAELLAAALSGTEATIDPTPYLPERFFSTLPITSSAVPARLSTRSEEKP